MEAPVLTYVAEVTTPKLRGLLAATGSSCIILGVFSQFVMGTFLKWRHMALINTAFPVLSIILLFFVPESPHWLIRKGRLEEAKRAFQWLRGWCHYDVVKEEYEQVHDLLARKPEGIDHEAKGLKSVFAPYFHRTFMHPYILIVFCFFVGHFSGMTTLQTFAVQIFHTLKAPIDKYYATMILGILELSGTIICVILVKHVGKRPLVLASTCGLGLCFLGTATYAYFLNQIPGRPVNNIVANLSQVPILNIIPLSTTTARPKNISEMLETTTEFDFNSTDYQEMTTDLETTSNSTDYEDNFSDQNSTETGLETLPKEIVNRWELAKNDLNISVDDYFNQTRQKPRYVVHPNDNKFLWIPLTLLLGAALLSHAGIRIIPWMLIGEVSL